MHILIADSDFLTRQMLSDILTKVGFDVTIASDGLEVLKKLPVADVLITEIELPRLSGSEIASIAKNSAMPVPIVAITKLQPEEVKDTPFVTVLHKPIRVEEVLHVIVRMTCPICYEVLKLDAKNNGDVFVCTNCKKSWSIQEKLGDSTL